MKPHAIAMKMPNAPNSEAERYAAADDEQDALDTGVVAPQEEAGAFRWLRVIQRKILLSEPRNRGKTYAIRPSVSEPKRRVNKLTSAILLLNPAVAVVIRAFFVDNTAMTMDGTNILDNALALDDDNRAALAYRLLQSLKPPGVITEEQLSFVDELQRRSAAYDTGETTADDWESVARRLRAALDAERPSSDRAS